MSSLFPRLPHVLGTYTLRRQLGVHAHSELYAAKQEHVNRQVIIEVLRPDADPGIVNFFLQSARARGIAKITGVAQVLESTSAEGIWFLAHEKPAGTDLETLYQRGEQLTPTQVCAILEAVARLYIECAQANLQATTLSRSDIFLNRTKSACSVRFLSPVYDQSAPATPTEKHMQTLADELAPLLPTHAPGQTRITTLMQWVRDGYDGEYLDWASIASTAAMVAEQLANDQSSALAALTELTTLGKIQRAQLKELRSKQRAARARRRFIFAAILILLCSISIGMLAAPTQPQRISPIIGDFIICETSLSGTRVQAAVQPVSISQYEQFLASLSNMDVATKARLRRGLPDVPVDFTPLAWQEQLSAAATQSQWQGRVITGDSPVTGVSYWAARAYANYHRGALPNVSLLTEIRRKLGQPNIQEWTSDLQPANVVLAPSRMVMVADSDRTIREADPAACVVSRGFRIILPYTTPQ